MNTLIIDESGLPGAAQGFDTGIGTLDMRLTETLVANDSVTRHYDATLTIFMPDETIVLSGPAYGTVKVISANEVEYVRAIAVCGSIGDGTPMCADWQGVGVLQR